MAAPALPRRPFSFLVLLFPDPYWYLGQNSQECGATGCRPSFLARDAQAAGWEAPKWLVAFKKRALQASAVDAFALPEMAWSAVHEK